MNHPSPHTKFLIRAFTLVELLVVIAILAAMLLPVLIIAKEKVKVSKAKQEITLLVGAIQSYHSTYSRYPCSTNAMIEAAKRKEDFTYFDGAFTVNQTQTLVQYDAPNSEVMAILMDIPDGFIGALPNPNWNHQKNPQSIKASFPISGYDPATGGTPLPGVDKNYVYRDPWGNPYYISMDLNYDEKCMDAVYRRKAVSQITAGKPDGYNGLVNAADNTGATDEYSFNGGVMVWSLGPDKKMDRNPLSAPGIDASQPPNKDNVLSWK